MYRYEHTGSSYMRSQGDNIKMDLIEKGGRIWIGIIWIRGRIGEWLLWARSHKRGKITYLLDFYFSDVFLAIFSVSNV